MELHRQIQPPLTDSSALTTYSSNKLADIAARVINELHLDHDHDHDYLYERNNDNDDFCEEEEDDESEFEFAILTNEDDNSSPISAGEIFSNGLIKPMYDYNYKYPVFDTSLIQQNDVVREEKVRLPLGRLMIEESGGGGGASCSSSEADDLDGVPQETYCVWVPKERRDKNDDVSMKKKSKSTGSNSKKWRIRDLLPRSNSDGKETFVFLTPPHKNNVGGDLSKGQRKPLPIASRKKTYLPYRQDLVGLFATSHNFSRNVRPF